MLIRAILTVVFFVLAGSACAKIKGGTGVEVAAVVPGSPDCYKNAGAPACPRDPSDPTGLPQAGTVCTLPVCDTCGSSTAAAYRDFTGAAQTGWCICVEKSDGSGIRTYSCGPRPWGSGSK
jgi:hypothetical protein